MDDILCAESRIWPVLSLLCPIQKEIRKTQGIPGIENAIEGSGILITRIEDGKITADWEENDQLGMMWQLGMELKPREGK